VTSVRSYSGGTELIPQDLWAQKVPLGRRLWDELKTRFNEVIGRRGDVSVRLDPELEAGGRQSVRVLAARDHASERQASRKTCRSS
jgi:hypothetical protein